MRSYDPERNNSPIYIGAISADARLYYLVTISDPFTQQWLTPLQSSPQLISRKRSIKHALNPNRHFRSASSLDWMVDMGAKSISIQLHILKIFPTIRHKMKVLTEYCQPKPEALRNRNCSLFGRSLASAFDLSFPVLGCGGVFRARRTASSRRRSISSGGRSSDLERDICQISGQLAYISKGSPQQFHALGVIAANFNRLEFRLLGLFMLYLGIDTTIIFLFSRLRDNALRIDIFTRTLETRAQTPEIKDAVEVLLQRLWNMRRQ